MSPTIGAPGRPVGTQDGLGDPVLEREHRAAPAATIATYWVSPAAPIPTTLPVSIWRGDAALIISSITRLLFSAATPVATHIP